MASIQQSISPREQARPSFAALAIKIGPEEMHLIGREAYIYFPNDQGRSKFPWPAIERALWTSGIGRNWNSVTKNAGNGGENGGSGWARFTPELVGQSHKLTIITLKKLKGAPRLGIYSPPVFSDIFDELEERHASSCHHRRARVGQSPGKIRSQPTAAGCKPSS
jgi:hypothetical protein